jgi:hypothetical protein
MADADNITLGGATVEVDSVDLGYTNGDIEVERTLELKDFEDNIPLQTVLRIPLREKFRAKIPMAEITIANLSLVALNVPVTNVSGGATNVADGDNQERTFADYLGLDLEAIILDGGTVTNLVLENVAENAVYTIEDDFFLDAVNGVVFRNPDGDITSGQTVRPKYDYVATASTRLRLGVNNPITNREVTLTHICPNSGRIFTIKMWKGAFTGNLNLSFKKQEFMTSDAEVFALPDPDNHPLEPLGYIDIQEAA